MASHSLCRSLNPYYMVVPGQNPLSALAPGGNHCFWPHCKNVGAES